jgi:hypothetical protein
MICENCDKKLKLAYVSDSINQVLCWNCDQEKNQKYIVTESEMRITDACIKYKKRFGDLFVGIFKGIIILEESNDL